MERTMFRLDQRVDLAAPMTLGHLLEERPLRLERIQPRHQNDTIPVWWFLPC